MTLHLGLKQPQDYYKVHLYILPDADNSNYDPTDVRYRNTIIKEREDWTVEDMSKVADAFDEYSKLSIAGNTILLENAANNYTVNNIAVGINKNTGDEEDNYLLQMVDTITETDKLSQYTITQSGTNFTITLQSNWKDFLANNQYVDVYFLTDQVLTDVGQQLREYVDERRLTSLQVTYHPLEIVHPTIDIDVYMNKDDIRFDTTAESIRNFIVDRFSREHVKIGEPLFESVIGHEILDNFDYLRYVEVNSPVEKIEVVPKGFIDVVPTVYDSDTDTTTSLINITMHDYQNRKI